MENKQKTIYDLKLHESMQILSDTHVMCVPGGFIYTTVITDTEKGTFLNSNQVFVPYDPPLILNLGIIDNLPEKNKSPKIYFNPE